MLFRDIPGNHELKTQLISTVKNNRIAHAQLFIGDKGSAKLAIAFAYARYINCEKKKEEDACEKCSSCLKYNTLAHPDLHLVFPVIKNKRFKSHVSDNFVASFRTFILNNPYQSLNCWVNNIEAENKKSAQPLIYKDEALLINKKVTLKKFEAKYRVFLFWMPEKMNRETSNKLLKLFEEPPNGTIFLLISESPNRLLPTIKSRFQQIKVHNFTDNDVVSFFKESNLSLEKIIKISKNNNSDFGKIKEILEQENYEIEFFQNFSLWMRLVYKVDIVGVTKFVDNISVIGRTNQKRFLSYCIKLIRECMIFNFAAKSLLQTNEIEKKFISKFSPYVHENNTLIIVDQLESAIKAINRNANAKIVLFDLSLQLVKCIKTKKVIKQ